MNRILFVDDEPRLLQGLRRMLHAERHRWDMVFADGPAEALRELAASPFDVVVTDYRMPDMTGGDLLRVMLDRHPGVARLILSGHTEGEELRTVVGVAHQFLTKPCDPVVLVETIDRAVGLRDRLTGSGIRDAIGGIDALPSPPSVVHELQRVLEAPEASVNDVAEVVEGDMALTARVLQLVNSSFFSLRRRVTDVNEAVGYLGVNTIKGLGLSAALMRSFGEASVGGVSIEQLEEQAVQTSLVARTLAGTDGSLGDDAFCAALLEEVGLLVLASRAGDAFAAAQEAWKEGGGPLADIEREVLGFTHGEVGAYLLNLWGLPDTVVACIADHGRSVACGSTFGLKAIVDVAHAVVEERRGVVCGGDHASVLAPSHLDTLGLTDRVQALRAVEA